MGIDKPSIRRIIHYGAVQTLEHYVQPDADAVEARNLINTSGSQVHCQRMLALNAKLTMFMKNSTQCRRLRLLEHFGEKPVQWAGVEAPPRGVCVIHSQE